MTTQAQIFFDLFPGRVICVSGTKGKSTTATLIFEVMQETGFSVALIGNIGSPVLNLWENPLPEWVVYETSSYMLDGLVKQNEISLLLNIYPDHLGWHGGIEGYARAKLSLLSGSKNTFIGSEVLKK